MNTDPGKDLNGEPIKIGGGGDKDKKVKKR